MQNREAQLQQWLNIELGTQDYVFERLPGDASFRIYYRIKSSDKNYIAMLAPPDKERTYEFVSIAKAWYLKGLPVPHIMAWEQKDGFVLMSDFGDRLMLDLLNDETVDFYYHHAMDLIIHLQNNPAALKLPHYDEAFIRLELSFFQEWFAQKLLNLSLNSKELEILKQIDNLMIKNFNEQPKMTVHRDYHSRNLMVLQDATLGVIDFQDAMMGPITYDLVSLLKDCYIAWPKESVNQWVSAFYEKQVKHHFQADFNLFLRWFDWVGLQRHLKVLGIFSRLNLRDNKPHYLQHIPRIFSYVLEVTQQYSVFNDFHHFLQIKVLPHLVSVLQQHNVLFDEKVRVA
ncbi:MAG: phosphotransferase [Proteobacteria bacterium]|nr:phosphotransferase [Pseudomonadota bacterium]